MSDPGQAGASEDRPDPTRRLVVLSYVGQGFIIATFFPVVVLAWIDITGWKLIAVPAGVLAVVGFLIMVLTAFGRFGQGSPAEAEKMAGDGADQIGGTRNREKFARQIFSTGSFMVVAGAAGCLSVAGLVYRGVLELPDNAPTFQARDLRQRYGLGPRAFDQEAMAMTAAAANRKLVAYRKMLEGIKVGTLPIDGSRERTGPSVADAGAGAAAGSTQVQGAVLQAGVDVASASSQERRWADQEGDRANHASIELSEGLAQPTAYVVVAWLMSILGALFFITNRLWIKGFGPAADRDVFASDRYWAGFFMRLGEAQIFTLVIILVLATGAGSITVSTQGAKPIDFSYKWLPLVGLMLGMFVKSGERVVFGLASRLFAAMEAFLPSRGERGAGTEKESQKEAQKGSGSQPSPQPGNTGR